MTLNLSSDVNIAEICKHILWEGAGQGSSGHDYIKTITNKLRTPLILLRTQTPHYISSVLAMLHGNYYHTNIMCVCREIDRRYLINED